MSQLVSALDTLYDKIIELLQEISDDDLVSNFMSGLSEDDQRLFEDLISALIVEINAFQDYKSVKSIYADLDQLETILLSLLGSFPSYLSQLKSYISLVLTISKKIFSLLTDDFQDKDLDVSSVALMNISVNTEVENFLYINQATADDFLILFTLNNEPEFNQFFMQANFSNIFILFLMLAKINSDFQKNNKYCLISRLDLIDKETAIVSFVELISVHEGKVVHKSIEYNNLPSKTSTSGYIYDIGQGYGQFSETIVILSEYNKEKGILEKYLKIYQVIENFMFRMPICELTNSTSPRMFSIREFKRLYSNVDKNELDALRLLINKIFTTINYDSHKKFGEFVLEKYYSITADPTKSTEIDTILPKLGMKVEPITTGSVAIFFTRLVYLLRNSVVHNKETEFHLSYGNLPDIVIYLLKEFVIVCLEEIIFNLIINRNSFVWYDNQYIQLYKD